MAYRRGVVRRHGITGRAVVLGTVVVLLVVILASPLHRYLAARAATHDAQVQYQQSTQQLAQLEQQNNQLSDPDYIKAQARKRLQYAMPGETVYVVVHPGQKPKTQTSAPIKEAATKLPGDTWHSRLWSTVKAADQQ